MTTQTYQEALDGMAAEVRRLYASKATGDLAALRRLDPDHPNARQRCGDARAHGHEPLIGNIDMLRRWARAAQLMAMRRRLRVEGLGETFVAIGLERGAPFGTAQCTWVHAPRSD